MRTCLGREDDQSVQVWRNRESMLRLCLGCQTTSTDPLKTAHTMPNLPWLRILVPAVAWGAIAWASAGAAAARAMIVAKIVELRMIVVLLPIDGLTSC